MISGRIKTDPKSESIETERRERKRERESKAGGRAENF
jgi:hypothetical protein